MFEEQDDKALEELFRKKLENTEVIPSESFRPVLMKNLAGKEFIHFIPDRFNIWYLAGIVATGAALVFFLGSGTGKSNEVQIVNPPDTTTESQISTPGKTVPGISPVISAANEKQTGVPVRKNRINKRSADIPENRNQAAVNQRETLPQNIAGNISGKDIINSQMVDKDKLQAGVKGFISQMKPSVTAGCIPLKVVFVSDVDPFATVRWEFGDGGCSESREPEWIFDNPGEYEVQLQVTGKDGSKTVSSTTINVYPRPAARFEISPGDAVIPDDEILFHNYSSGAVRYEWDFGDGTTSELYEPKHKFSRFGNYNLRLVAISESGCTDTISLANAFAGSGYLIDFPNAFIPNPNGPSGGYYSPTSDEYAHVFHPSLIKGVSDYQLRIFTRLGILIFESNDINIGWDGYFKGQLSEPGVYIWKVRGNYVNGEPFTKMGDVTLLRSQ